MKSFLLFLFTASAFAQLPALVQSNGNTGGSTCTFGRNVTSGDVLIIGRSWESSTSTPSVSDSLGTSFTQAVLNTGFNVRISVYVGTASSSGADTITATVSGSSFDWAGCAEIKNVTATVDVSGSSNWSGSPSTISQSVTTTTNTDFLYVYAGGFRSAGTFFESFGNGYHFLGQGNGNDSFGHEFSVSGAAGSCTATMGTNSNDQGSIAVVALKPNALAIDTAALPHGATSLAYDFTLVGAGGAGAYTWSVAGGMTPGLTLNASTGRISGTPTRTASRPLAVSLTDGTNTATATLQLNIGTSLGTVTHVQDKAGSTSVTLTSNVTSGNVILVGQFLKNGQAVGGCTDTRGTVYFLINSGNYTQGFPNGYTLGFLWAGNVTSTGSDTITCGGSSLAASEFSNVFAAADNHNETTGTTGTTITFKFVDHAHAE